MTVNHGVPGSNPGRGANQDPAPMAKPVDAGCLKRSGLVPWEFDPPSGHHIKCRSGGTGRRGRFKSCCPLGVGVRFPPSAPIPKDPHGSFSLRSLCSASYSTCFPGIKAKVGQREWSQPSLKLSHSPLSKLLLSSSQLTAACVSIESHCELGLKVSLTDLVN